MFMVLLATPLINFHGDMWGLSPTSKNIINPSQLNPGQREKIKAFKAFLKPFEAPQKSVKIKLFSFNFLFQHNFEKCPGR